MEFRLYINMVILKWTHNSCYQLMAMVCYLVTTVMLKVLVQSAL